DVERGREIAKLKGLHQGCQGEIGPGAGLFSSGTSGAKLPVHFGLATLNTKQK
ncbi:Hypothetical protein FKW44_021521, partial [Caligus rogercresseyi]